MKTTISVSGRSRIAAMFSVAASSLSLVPPTVQAATNTWLGNTDANWNTGANWSTNPLPAGDTPVFGIAGTSGSTLNNDTTAGTSYAGITFNNSASHFTIGGNSITLGGNVTVGTNAFEILNCDLALDATRSLSVDTGSALFLGGVVSGSFGITTAGAGILFPSGLNTYSGVTTVSAGTLDAGTLAIGGNPSSIGQSTSDAANLILAGGSLRYTGPAVSTDRSFSLTANSTLDAFGSGALDLSNAATPGYGVSNEARTLTLTGMNPGNNTLAALLANNGTGVVSVTKTGSGTWLLSGANTYTGVTNIDRIIAANATGYLGAGTLVATVLDNGGSPSSIGASTNAANNLLLGNGTVLKYIGSGHSTDRSFTINNTSTGTSGATLDASGMGAVNFTSTTTPAYGATNRLRFLTLGGSSTATNTLSALLANNGTAALALVKSGTGTWSLNGTAVNTYTGATNVNGGTLIADFANLATPTNLINSGSALSFGGGTLAVKGKDSSATSQTFGNPTFAASGAGSGLSVTGGSGSTATLVLGNTWTRNLGSTVNVTLGAGGTVTSSPVVANSLVTGSLVTGSANIAFATVAGADWAKVDTGTVVGFGSGDYTAGLPASGADSSLNYSQADNASVTESQTVNTLKLTTTTVGQALAIAADQTLTLNAGGLLFVGGNDYSITGGTLLGSPGAQKELVIHHFGSGLMTVESLIADSGSATALTKAGPGNLTLTNANTHSGATSVSGGTLTLKNANALASSTLNLNGASLVFDSSVTGNAFTLGGLNTVSTSPGSNGPGYDIALQNNAATPAPIVLTVGGNNATTTYNGSLTGPGDLVKAGSGILNIRGPNSYTGTTTVNAGTLLCFMPQLDSFLGTRPGGPDVTVESPATLAFNRNNITGTLRLNGGTVTHGNAFATTWSGSVVLGATSTVSITGNMTFNAIISGTGGLTKTGAAVLTLTRANAYTGPTSVTAGTLQCDTRDALGSGALSISGTGKANLNYVGTKTVASLTLGGVAKTAPGTYGSIASGANFPDSNYFTTGSTGTVTVASGYSAWAALYAGGAEAPADGDFNNDGVQNGIAFFMGMDGLATHPGVVGNSVTWPYVNAVPPYKVQTSTDLSPSGWTDVLPSDPRLVVTAPGPSGSVSYNLLPPAGSRLFVRLLVTP